MPHPSDQAERLVALDFRRVRRMAAQAIQVDLPAIYVQVELGHDPGEMLLYGTLFAAQASKGSRVVSCFAKRTISAGVATEMQPEWGTQKTMPSLTLKGIPEDVMKHLRSLAEQERRSLNQQAILLLEQALEEQRPSFTEAYEAFLQKHGPSFIDDESFDAAFEGLRSREMGRPSPFEDNEANG